MLKESYESFPKLIQEMIHEKNVDVEMNHFIQSFFQLPLWHGGHKYSFAETFYGGEHTVQRHAKIEELLTCAE